MSKPKLKSALAIAKLLHTEGFTDYVAGLVAEHALKHATEGQRRRLLKSRRLFSDMVKAKLSDVDKLVLGKYMSTRLKMSFETGLRMGLAAFATMSDESRRKFLRSIDDEDGFETIQPEDDPFKTPRHSAKKPIDSSCQKLEPTKAEATPLEVGDRVCLSGPNFSRGNLVGAKGKIREKKLDVRTGETDALVDWDAGGLWWVSFDQLSREEASKKPVSIPPGGLEVGDAVRLNDSTRHGGEVIGETGTISEINYKEALVDWDKGGSWWVDLNSLSGVASKKPYRE